MVAPLDIQRVILHQLIHDQVRTGAAVINIPQYVQMVNDQMLLQQTLMVEAVRQKKSAEALLKQLNDSREYPSEEAAMTEFNQAKGKWKAAEAASKEAEKKEKASSEELVNCTA